MKLLFKKILILLIKNFSFPLYYKLKAKSQNDNKEAIKLFKLSQKNKINRSFIEFGFHPYELNSHILLRKNYKGLFIDSNEKICLEMNKIISKLNVNSKAIDYFITVNQLDPIFKFITDLKEDLGILSIDIDGNDYWILKKILSFTKPHLICVEHNASLGTRNITTPYIEIFDRHKFHESGFYHGGSITAFHSLLVDDYDLIINVEGLNLIFLRKDKNVGIKALNPIEAYKESTLRNILHGTSADEQWKLVENLYFEKL